MSILPYLLKIPYLLLIATLALTVSVETDAQDVSTPGSEDGSYIGADKCGSCHQPEFSDWLESDHFRAMAVANPDSMLGDFADVTVVFHGIKSQFSKREDQYFITTTNQDNLQETFQVKYSFGHYPLQQYLIETGKGHIQAFNVAWDSRSQDDGGQRWFHLRDDENIDPQHPFFWTGHFQNWNSRCADCHSTNLRKNYDTDQNSYQTLWSDINVGCEACHGPGSLHYEKVLANQILETDTGFNVDMPKTGTWALKAGADYAVSDGLEVPQSKTSTLNMCGGCHSRRASLTQMRPGADYHDQFQMRTLGADLYHVDGQINEEVFVMGSFMQSKMHQKGVTCGNCHNVHSTKLLVEGNGLCLQCHRSETFNVPDHHGHQVSSSGGQCVNCHMPETTYMTVDPRRDHSFSIPRPDLSIELGVPNACVGCHQGKTDQWAQQVLENLNPTTPSGADSQSRPSGVLDAWARANRQSQELDPLVTREVESLIEPPRVDPIRHATLLDQLAPMPSRVSAQLAAKGLKHEDPLVRRAAVASIQSMPPEIIVGLLSTNMAESSLVVRAEMGLLFASIIDRVPLEIAVEANKLIEEYRTTLEYGLDTPANLSSLASLNIYLGYLDTVESLYLKALEIEPAYVPAMVNLADWYRSRNLEQEAGVQLRHAVSVAPDSAMAQHALGLQMVRLGQYSAALKYLQQATELEGTLPRYYFVYAVALENQGRLDDSILILTKAVERWPNQYDLLLTLVNFMDRQGDLLAAGTYISQLSRIAPASPQVKSLLAKYQQQLQ